MHIILLFLLLFDYIYIYIYIYILFICILNTLNSHNKYIQDWKLFPKEHISNHAINKSKPGDIILCHDIFPNTIDAIPALIDGLKAKGIKQSNDNLTKILFYHSIFIFIFIFIFVNN